jgi:ubiquitin-activating enzyme E1
VWNALDNVVARRYTDSKCVLHERPLLESGTLGTKANCETILPHQTQSYSEEKEQVVSFSTLSLHSHCSRTSESSHLSLFALRLQEEDSIPMCTLRNFPHFPEHCIEWARAQFSDWFEDMPSELNALLRDPQAFFSQLEKEGSVSVQLEQLRRVSRLLGGSGQSRSDFAFTVLQILRRELVLSSRSSSPLSASTNRSEALFTLSR